MRPFDKRIYIYIYLCLACAMALLVFSPGCGSSSGKGSTAAAGASVTRTVADDPITTPVDPSQDPFETADWDIVSFTDPRTAEVYDIIDGRVIIALADPPVLPTLDPNYFDTERAADDTAYSQVTYNYELATTTDGVTQVEDPDIAAFLEAEDLEVYAEWPMVGGLAAVLPEGQTVADAVANWPSEYPDLIEAVDPDAIGTPELDYPDGDPNDEKFASQWAINESSSDYNINIREVQRNHTYGRGSANRVIAILDTGVDYSLEDLQGNSTPYGCNTGDKRASTQFLTRSAGGGEPWDWLLLYGGNSTQRFNQTQMIGHGTCMAGVCSAVINNDETGSTNDDRDIAGAAEYPRYFSVAMKYKLGYSSSAILNAFTAIGCVKGICNEDVYYSSSLYVPYYNIEVVNCSFSAGKTTTGERHLNKLSPYMLFVCAAGNDGSRYRGKWPAMYSAAISVAAYDQNGARWTDSWTGYASNYHSSVDIAAPGKDIYTTDMRGYSGSYTLGFSSQVVAEVDGTSIAAPYVSAVAALIAGLPGSPSPAATLTRITTNSGDLTGDLAFCGRLDAWEAMQ